MHAFVGVCILYEQVHASHAYTSMYLVSYTYVATYINMHTHIRACTTTLHIHSYIAAHMYTYTYIHMYVRMYICMYILTWDPGLALYLSSAGTQPHKGTGLNLHVTTKHLSAQILLTVHWVCHPTLVCLGQTAVRYSPVLLYAL